MSIERFKGDYSFLSSMYVVEGGMETPEGIVAPSLEHIYQASKFVDKDLREQVLMTQTGYKAKNFASMLEKQGFTVRPDWSYAKVDIMRGLVHQKFVRHSELGEKLLATGDEELIEGNTWKDTFWGVYPLENNKLAENARGLNWLGRILMETRDELQAADVQDGATNSSSNRK